MSPSDAPVPWYGCGVAGDVTGQVVTNDQLDLPPGCA